MTIVSLAGRPQYKYLNFLFCIFITLQYICDILVLRIFVIDKISFTASSAIFCVNFALLDIVANVYGMQEAQKLAWINFFAQFLIATLLYLFLFNFTPTAYSSVDYTQTAIQLKSFGLTISKNMLVIPIAVLIGNLSNSLLMMISKYIFFGRFIALRTWVCSLAGALLMLSISYTKIYWHLGFPYIVQIIFSSMLIKLIGATILMYPSQFLSNVLRTLEGVDVYDLKFKFLQHRQNEIFKRFG